MPVVDASATSSAPSSSPSAPSSSPPAPSSSPPAPSSSPPAPSSSAPSSTPPVATTADISALLRKDGENRAAGPGIGRGLAVLALTAALVPVVVVAAALWPTARPIVGSAGVSTVVAQSAPVVVDFEALRAAARARPAVTASAAPAAASGMQQFIAIEPERVEKARLLLKRVFKARDVRRSGGADVKELRRPFSVEDLGGQAMLNEVGIAKGKRVLITRDFLKPEAKLVAPAGAKLPEGVELASTERDEDVIETDATLDGKPVHIMRRCLAGELLCLVDIVPVASAAASAPAPTAAAAVAAPTDDALLAAIDAEEAKFRAAPATKTASGSVVVPTTRVPPTGGTALGIAIALLLGGLLATRLARLGSLVAAAGHRVRALVAGRAGAAPSGLPAELAALHTAIDEAAIALGDVRHRADIDESRRTRLVDVASALERAKERSTSRVLPNASDDASLAAVVEAANKLLDTYEARVLRWKSHAETALAPPAHSKVEERAQALAPIPPLLVEVAQRLLRVARLPELQPAKAKDELNAVGEALAQRGRTAQTLVDQLLLDAATDRPGSAPSAALSALRQELGALTPSSSAPATVAALRDLPVDQIAQRMAKP